MSDETFEVVTIQRSMPLDDIALEGDGRTLVARLMRWNVVNEVSDDGISVYRERWKKGVFANNISRMMERKARWPLFAAHPRPGHSTFLPVGVAASIHEREDGPWMTGRISRTQMGDEIVELIRDGALPGVSVGARVVRTTLDGSIRDRVEAAINEITITPFPALHGADILALRDGQGTPSTSKPALDDLDSFLQSLKRP